LVAIRFSRASMSRPSTGWAQKGFRSVRDRFEHRPASRSP
jgi:hypothetical protein